VVEKIRVMVEEDQLMSGDKIPSERELTERLNVGRSSVREALRALELLGLIETRRGEGTFIRDFQDHYLIELLGTFFLKNNKVKQDLVEAKTVIELDFIRLVAHYDEQDELLDFFEWLKKHDFDDQLFFRKIAAINRNRLLERIWSIITEYSNTIEHKIGRIKTIAYIELLEAIINRDEEQSIRLYYENIRMMSKTMT
jgi:GntR family transcriptional regulator, transcriptional repressor for pyruvate dehydrogenase complex